MMDTVFRRLSIAIMSLLIVGGLFVFFPNQSQAQNFDYSIEAKDIQLSLNPPTPGTNQRVTVSLDSYIVNLNRMLITWFLDGEVVLSGLGETEIDVTIKNQGELTRIEAYIQIDNETNIRKWIQIAPADLDIVWEANTYTPPFYRGKALPTPESHITVVGLPNLRNQGIQALEEGVVFNWNHNGENLPDASGFGANPLVIRNDFLKKTERITLNVIHQDGLSSAEKNLNINIVDPKVVLYQENIGLRNGNNLDVSQLGNQTTATVIAEPYYFSTRPELINLLTFRWRLNGSQITTIDEANKNRLTVQGRGDGTVSTLSVFIENPIKLLQDAASGNITVIQ